ncbi:MAG: AbrB/MazE/SpoVT family DNA-binding domain-containing protein [Candidatus Woesearchaeota archaeon]
MKRKLIKQGHNTTTVTLPINWVKKLNLKSGDEVDVEEQGNSLIINGKESNQHKSTTLDISDFTVPMIWRFFQPAYRQGYDEIKVAFNPDKKNFESVYHYYTTQFAYTKLGEKRPAKPAVDMIQELIDRFIGIEIMDIGKNYCIIKDMTEPTTKEYPNSLRRIFMIISNIFDRVITAIENNEIGDIKICKELHTMDLNADRFIDYCCRILNKINDSAPQRKKASIFASLFILELLSDEFKYIGVHLAKANKKVSDILPFGEKVREHFKLYENLFYNFDRDLAIKFGKNDFSIYDEHSSWKKKIAGENKSIAGHLMQISKYLLCLVELRIEMES